MIEILPRDHAPLEPDAEEVLRAVYEEYDQTSSPVLARGLAFRLKDRVKHVRNVLGNQLRDYLKSHRADGDEGFTPKLRAALRLWKVEDLKLVDDFYEIINQRYRPERAYLTGGELRQFAGSDRRLKRLQHLVADETFASISAEASDGEAAVQIPDQIIDAPTLTDYLMERYRTRRSSGEAAVPRAQVWLRGIHIQGFRTHEDSAIEGLGQFTALTGRNDVGKSNFLRALRFVSNFACQGVARALAREGSLRSLFPRAQTPSSGVLDIRALMKTEAYDSVSYSIRLRQSAKSVVESEHLSLPGRVLVHQDQTIAKINDSAETMHLARDESALSSLHDVQTHREAIAIREGLRAWSFFHFEPSRLRAGAHYFGDLIEPREQHFELDESGTDLARALSRLGSTDPAQLEAIAAAFKTLIPEAEGLSAQVGLDGKPLILLRERNLTDPLTQHDLSDGLLRILALLYLAHHPEPPTLVVVEEPENGLYPRLIEAMVDTLLSLSQRVQVMITTHSVQLLNRLSPDQVVYVSRTARGSQLTRLESRRDVMEAAAEFGVGDQLRMGHIEGK